jgi:peptidyl-tRNA hydrolase
MLEAEDQIKIEKNEIVQLVVFVRMDLNMSNGKIAAQCAHVTLKAFQNGRAHT